MNLLHTRGLDIPIYPADTEVVWRKQDLALVARSINTPDFLRRVTLELPERPSSLTAALRIADETIAEAMDAIGINAVSPEWGLYRHPTDPAQAPQHERIHQSDPIVPANHSLVARVALVADARPLTLGERETVGSEIRRYRQTKRDRYLGDIGTWQCVHGKLDPNKVPQITYVDIEPRIRSVA